MPKANLLGPSERLTERYHVNVIIDIHEHKRCEN